RKGRVVLVGDVPIQINRDAIYAKELDFFISTSYGPGRYDKSFEEEGLSYPIGYVRWTETRNMAAYLDLIAARRIKVDDLIGAEFGLDDAGKAYAALNSADRPLSVILSYPETPADVLRSRTRFYERTQPDRASPKSTDAHDRTGGPGVRSSGRISLGVIGPGGFFKSTLLPILEKEASRFTISAIATRQGHSAHSLAERTKAALATTDPSDLVQHQDVNAVMIATRHDTHARLVLESLRSGKHVFVEKPLCLSSDELSQIADFFESGEATGTPPVLLTGFNRRFSRTAQELKKAVSRRTQPMIMNYRVNAGFVPPESWVHGSEGGGRNIGEACHFYDMFTFLADAEVTSVTARAISPQSPHYRRDDNFVASITFSDGSIATLTYSALGNPAFPKEQLEVHCDGQIFTLDDYRRLTQAGRSKPLVEHRTSSKGHDAELVAFAQAVTSGDGSPIPLWQQFQAMQIAFRVQEEIS
ncbi:MAG: Gfo/Idh/MocA family oxidoreductase, partial [Pseudomonadota bacterium]